MVGFAPGGAADFVARAFQEPLGRALGQPIVVENRPGAGSSIAAEHVAKSAPDGYTVLIASPSSILVNPLISPKAGFQPLKDLVPISKVSSSPLILAVNPGARRRRRCKELIAHAKKNPGKLNYATSGNGSAPHLAAVLFLRLARSRHGARAVQGRRAGGAVGARRRHAARLRHAALGAAAGAGGPPARARDHQPRTRRRSIPGVPGMAEAGLPDYEIRLLVRLLRAGGHAGRRWCASCSTRPARR